MCVTLDLVREHDDISAHQLIVSVIEELGFDVVAELCQHFFKRETVPGAVFLFEGGEGDDGAAGWFQKIPERGKRGFVE